MQTLNDLVEKAELAKAKSAYVNYVSSSDIFEIAEAFRELGHRLKVAEQGEKTFEDGFCSVREDRDEWKQRAEAAEAKLAEYGKQEPVAYTDAEELKVMQQGTYADMFTPHDSYKSDPQWIPLFTRPAPAVSLVELTFDYTGEGDFYGWGFYDKDGKEIDIPKGSILTLR